MSDGLSILDSNCNYTLFNKAAREMFPTYSDVEQTGDGFYKAEFYYESEGNKIPLDRIPSSRVKNGEKFTNMRMKVKLPDKVLHISVSGTPIYDKNNNFVMGVLCSRDISKVIEYEQKLKDQKMKLLESEREKNQALKQAIEMKDEFLSLISHELRTPITVIDSAIQAMSLICWDELPDKSRKYIKTIKQNTYRQLRLVNNLLDIIRVNAGRIKVNKINLDIVFLTRSILENVYIYAAKSGVKLKFVLLLLRR